MMRAGSRTTDGCSSLTILPTKVVCVRVCVCLCLSIPRFRIRIRITLFIPKRRLRYNLAWRQKQKQNKETNKQTKRIYIFICIYIIVYIVSISFFANKAIPLYIYLVFVLEFLHCIAKNSDSATSLGPMSWVNHVYIVNFAQNSPR